MPDMQSKNRFGYIFEMTFLMCDSHHVSNAWLKLEFDKKFVDECWMGVAKCRLDALAKKITCFIKFLARF